MRLCHAPEDLRRASDEARARGAVVGLGPTMGALHAGHVRLIAEARDRCGFVIVTVFVNPTQFGPNEDYAKYPRTLERDAELSAAHGASLVFAPDPSAMYAPGDETRVRVGSTAAALCGEHRPGHFEGVTTIVAKLFALTGPALAFFGRKDYQQYRVIDRMARDLMFPIEIVGVATVREPDGVALSSRNRYLSPSARAAARAIPEGLRRAAALFARGERSAGELRRACLEHVRAGASSVDYVTVADPMSVAPLTDGERAGERALLAVAARFEGTRLIDNLVLGEDRAPPPPAGQTGDA